MSGGVLFDVLCLGGTIEVQNADGFDDTIIAYGPMNPYELAATFAAWLTNGARPWAGSLTSVSWSVEPDGAGGLVFVFVPVGTVFTHFYMDGEVQWAARLSGIDAGAQVGTVAATVASMTWERWDTEGGARCRSVSWRVGHPLGTHRRPSVELALDLDGAWALSEAMRVAIQPRRAYLYDELTDSWRAVTVGRIDTKPHRPDDPTGMLATIEVLG